MSSYHLRALEPFKQDFGRPETNYALFTSRFVEFDFSDPAKKRIDIDWIRKMGRNAVAFRDICNRFKNEQTQILSLLRHSGYEVACFSMDTDWRFAPGLGAAHVQETGICLEHIYGLPYLPGSGVKGVTRAYVVEYILNRIKGTNLNCLDQLLDVGNLKNLIDVGDSESIRQSTCFRDSDGLLSNLPDELLDIILHDNDYKRDLHDASAIFGSQGAAGQVTFMDAYPITLDTTVDIMNPHYPEYYSENKPWPQDSEDPRPVKFLTAKNATFVFSLVSRSVQLTSQGMKWLQSTLTEIGAGAKTAVGYGYFRKFNRCDEGIENSARAVISHRRQIEIRRNMTQVEKWSSDISDKGIPWERANSMISDYVKAKTTEDTKFSADDIARIEEAIFVRVKSAFGSGVSVNLLDFILKDLLPALEEKNAGALAETLLRMKLFQKAEMEGTRKRLQGFFHDEKIQSGISEILSALRSNNLKDKNSGIAGAIKILRDPLVEKESKMEIAGVANGLAFKKGLKRKEFEKLSQLIKKF